MKYNDIYVAIFHNYCDLGKIICEDVHNYYTHKPTLSKHDRETIWEAHEYLRQALDILKPNTCKTVIGRNKFGNTIYIYEKGE